MMIAAGFLVPTIVGSASVPTNAARVARAQKTDAQGKKVIPHGMRFFDLSGFTKDYAVKKLVPKIPDIMDGFGIGKVLLEEFNRFLLGEDLYKYGNQSGTGLTYDTSTIP